MGVFSTEETFDSLIGNGMRGKGRQVFSHSEVHIYFINPQEGDNTKRDSTTARLVMIAHEDQNPFSEVIPPAFLQAGGWFYPLIPSKSPVYRTEEKYYIFPDLSSSAPGASVGIVFPDSMTTEERDLFENILLTFAGLNEFPTGCTEKFGNPAELITNADAAYDDDSYYHFEPWETQFPRKSKAEELGDEIKILAERAAHGIKATKTFQFMAYETQQAKSHLNADLEAAKKFTGHAVELSSHAVSRVKDATLNLAGFIALKKGTSALRTKVTAATDGARHTMERVYEALYNAGKSLAHSITHNPALDYRDEAEKPEPKIRFVIVESVHPSAADANLIEMTN